MPSRVPADALVELGGSVRRQDGRPVEGAAVALLKEPDPLEVWTFVASAGLACLTDRAGRTAVGVEEMCRDARIETTGAEARFLFRLKGRDTQGPMGTASTMELSTGLTAGGVEAEGPAVTLRFRVQRTPIDLALRFWEPKVEAATDGRRAFVEWTRPTAETLLPGVRPADLHASVRFERAAGEIVWDFRRAEAPLRFDPRLLEDARGTLAVYAAATGIDHEAIADETDLMLRSARLRFAGPAGAPVSRGRPCFVLDAAGRPVELTPCRLTDGDFRAEYEPRTGPACKAGCTPEPRHASTFIDLGSDRTISLVVVRGCDDCTVQASADARRWHTIGIGSDEDAALAPRVPPRARYLRVSAGLGVETLREISVWDSSARVPAGTLLVAGVTERDGGERDGRRATLLILAGVGLGLLALALGALVLRHRAR